MRYTARSKGQAHEIDVTRGPDGWRIAVGDRAFEADVLQVGPALYSLLIEGRSYEVDVLRADDGFIVLVNGQPFAVEIGPAHAAESAAPGVTARKDWIRAPMPGRVVKLLVKPQDDVRAGDPLVVLEAMKMENELRAPADGRVREVRAQEHQPVNGGDPLVLLE